MDSTKRLGHCRLSLSEYKFDFFKRAEIKHRATDELLLLLRTAQYRTQLEDDLPILSDDETKNENEIRITDTICAEV